MNEYPILQSRLSLDIRDMHLAENCALELQKSGFQINKVTARGVHFEGPVVLYEETFQSKVELSETGSRFERIPTMPASIDSGIATVYFPSRPTYFYGTEKDTDKRTEKDVERSVEKDVEKDAEKEIEGDTNDRRNPCKTRPKDKGCSTDSPGVPGDYASTGKTTDP